MLLTEQEINEKLETLSNWKKEKKEITKTYKFADFIESMKFVNLLVEPAEKLGHHPDIIISYNKVTLVLSTHDEGGLTDKDFDLAKQFDSLI